MGNLSTAALLALLTCITPAMAQAFDWQDLWQTATQRAQSQHDKGEFDVLAEQAPGYDWTGLASYRAGNFAAAGKAYAADREQRTAADDLDGAVQATYNQANAALQNRQYQDALSLYEQVLADDPSHADALHNQTIAEQAYALQPPPPPAPGDEGDEQPDGEQTGEQGQSGEAGDQSSRSGDESASEEAQQNNSDSQQNNTSGADGDAAQPADDQQDSDSAEEQAERDAAAALAASAQAEASANGQEGELMGLSEQAPPLTETEQATEQWLRRIPDNPAGLLRRKLQRSHQNEYPEVGDSAHPW